ncbi:hypothetical protein ACVWZK_006433 [Bradyrhizobium sp. GM0.4]
MNIPWTEDEMSTLRQLWQKGLSASQIGARLGKSRNAVLGKLHRLGDSGRVLIVDPVKLKLRAEERRQAHVAKERRRRARLASGLGSLRAPRAIEPVAFKAPVVPSFVSKTSPSYRDRLVKLPDMTVGQRRDMLAEAVRNTAAMPVEG